MASRAFGPQKIWLWMMGAANDVSDNGAADDEHCQQWTLGTVGAA